jgi:hypothetical protein
MWWTIQTPEVTSSRNLRKQSCLALHFCLICVSSYIYIYCHVAITTISNSIVLGNLGIKFRYQWNIDKIILCSLLMHKVLSTVSSKNTIQRMNAFLAQKTSQIGILLVRKKTLPNDLRLEISVINCSTRYWHNALFVV